MTGWFVENAEERAAVDEMEANPDRPAAIVMASLVETRLTLALDAVMEDHPNIKKDIFRPSGPLGSFSAKTDIALLFGFISPDAYRDLVLLRRIRNEFPQAGSDHLRHGANQIDDNKFHALPKANLSSSREGRTYRSQVYP